MSYNIEDEAWHYAKKLGLHYEDLYRLLIRDDVILDRIHRIGFDNITREQALRLFSDRMAEYKQMPAEEWEASPYRLHDIKRLVSWLTKTTI